MHDELASAVRALANGAARVARVHDLARPPRAEAARLRPHDLAEQRAPAELALLAVPLAMVLLVAVVTQADARWVVARGTRGARERLAARLAAGKAETRVGGWAARLAARTDDELAVQHHCAGFEMGMIGT